ncbi:MAG: hypothetical protein JO362_14775 [Streptomycetaceae bacterium]|nr:hypothetical protein [Streptomycetaceae bacterium]
MRFNIKFTGETAEDDDLVAVGEITLGEDWERFHAPIDYWSTRDYEQSWRIALNRLVDGEEVSCLITSMFEAKYSNFLTIWPLYRIGNQVHVQNELLFPEDLDKPFNASEPWLSVGPRETVSDDGRPISEWVVSLDEVRRFLEGRDADPKS